jgi:hypothetical protein
MMGYHTLREIGETGERHHDSYVKDANRLAQHMFVENAQGVDRGARPSVSPDLDAFPP